MCKYLYSYGLWGRKWTLVYSVIWSSFSPALFNLFLSLSLYQHHFFFLYPSNSLALFPITFLLHRDKCILLSLLLLLLLSRCDPTDGSPPGSPVPGILQARTLEWVAISFSNAWKWKVKVKLLSGIQLLVTPWTAAHQAPPFMGFSRQEYWSGVPLPSPSYVAVQF